MLVFSVVYLLLSCVFDIRLAITHVWSPVVASLGVWAGRMLAKPLGCTCFDPF